MRTLKELEDEKNGTGGYRISSTPEGIKFKVDTIRFSDVGFGGRIKVRSKRQQEIVKHLDNFVIRILAERREREQRKNELLEELIAARTTFLILKDRL